MTAQALASALEGKREGHEWRARCPVHGGRSLCIRERAGKVLVVCRAGCSQSNIIRALREMCLWGNVSCLDIQLPPGPEPENDMDRRIRKAEKMWDESHPIESGDPVHKYLTGRGIVIDTWPDDLHTHPALPYWTTDEKGKPVKTGTFPAMLAVVRSSTGKPVAIHRTYITSDGRKAPVDPVKKAYGVHPMQGGAVRLFPPRDGLLAVCEGIEDALSVWVLWKISTWACLGTSGFRSFEPPEGVRELLIFADRDQNQAGQRAAWALADRMEEKRMAVRVRIPSGHKDINQLLRKNLDDESTTGNAGDGSSRTS